MIYLFPFSKDFSFQFDHTEEHIFNQIFTKFNFLCQLTILLGKTLINLINIVGPLMNNFFQCFNFHLCFIAPIVSWKFIASLCWYAHWPLNLQTPLRPKAASRQGRSQSEKRGAAPSGQCTSELHYLTHGGKYLNWANHSQALLKWPGCVVASGLALLAGSCSFDVASSSSSGVFHSGFRRSPPSIRAYWRPFSPLFSVVFPSGHPHVHLLRL